LFPQQQNIKIKNIIKKPQSLFPPNPHPHLSGILNPPSHINYLSSYKLATTIVVIASTSAVVSTAVAE